MNIIFQKRIFYTMLEGFLMKYVWSAIGMNIIAFPTFLADYKETTRSQGNNNLQCRLSGAAQY